GCSVADATGESVIIALNCGNLLPAARNIQRLFPERELVVAADNDHRSRGNPGVNAAIRVFEETGIPFVYPDFDEEDGGTDWNDYTAKHGLKRCQALMLRKLAAFKNKGLYRLKHSEPQFVDLSEGGRPLGTVENLRALLAFAGMTVEYNEIKKEEIFSMPGRVYCGDNAKNAAIGEILSLCSRWRLPKSDIEPLISNIGSQNISNPVKDWILSEPWDGMCRIRNVFDSLVEEKYFPRPFKETLVRRWLISGVAAVFMKRGFRCRGVLTFVGGQGIGKTTWFRTLFGKDDFFSEGVGLNLKDKDSVKAAISAWGVEYGELEGTFSRSEVPILKAFLTRGSDKIRMPWSRKESDFQRRTIYGATVNQRQFLIDDTGNARWWCIPLDKIAALDRGEMQQMWREVYERYYLMHLKEPDNEEYQWWLTKEEDAMLAEQNREFEVPSSVEEIIASRLEWECMRELWELKTTTQILYECGYPPGDIKTGTLIKAGKVLAKLTGETSKPMGHANARMWRVPPKRTIFTDLHKP
ncbi:MAG: VapE family protein, partial [Cloacibacillus sp.]